ncbi:hypothetical protein HPB50_006779 [Hyalomma asiaticum]|uniref:Uncharacterized protein n=1 Tax=Hyalomma asiaticum TaxID=266040 RepID=A0ACB7SSH8_HYAAI|nr:hypothetical protein HPB50_006779 [Hyalomma asiaticum]
MPAGHSMSYGASRGNRSELHYMHQETGRFLSVPQLRRHPSPQHARDPNRVMSDPVDARCAKSPWTSTAVPNRNKMPNQLIHHRRPQAPSPRFAVHKTMRKKLVRKTDARRQQRSKSRPSSRSKRRSPSPAPAISPTVIPESSSDESVMAKSARRLLPELNRKGPSPARSCKPITRSKATPTTASGRKPTFSRQSTSREHHRDAEPPKRHANSPSPPLATVLQPMQDTPGQDNYRTSFNRAACDDCDDVLSPASQAAPSSNLACLTMLPVRPVAEDSIYIPDPPPLCSSDRGELYPRTGDWVPLETPRLDKHAHFFDASGQRSVQDDRRSPTNFEVQRVPAIAGMRRNNCRQGIDAWRSQSAVSRTSSSSGCSGGGHFSGIPASSGKATRPACAALCLAAAAVLSFSVFYAITDAVISDRASTEYRGDPMTVRPEDERRLGHARNVRLYEHGPHLKIGKALWRYSSPVHRAASFCRESDGVAHAAFEGCSKRKELWDEVAALLNQRVPAVKTPDSWRNRWYKMVHAARREAARSAAEILLVAATWEASMAASLMFCGGREP